MSSPGDADKKRAGPPLFRSALAWLSTLVGTTLVSVIGTESLANVSRLLAVAYRVTVLALLARHLAYLCEGCYGMRLERPMLAEPATPRLWASFSLLITLVVVNSHDPGSSSQCGGR